MGKNKKFKMNLVDEGYDDEFMEKVRIEKEKLKLKEMEEEQNKNSFNILNYKNIIIIVIWGLLYRLFIHWGFGLV